MCRINNICENCLYLEGKTMKCNCFSIKDNYTLCIKCKENILNYKINKNKTCKCNIL